MRTRTILAAALCVFSLSLLGCSSILETERVIVTPHEDMSVQSPDTEPTPNASNYEELLSVTRDFLERRQNSGRIIVHEYDGNLDSDLITVRDELLYHDALGAYALSDLTLFATPIVSYRDIQIELFYRRSAEQIDNIITISTERYLRIELRSMMSENREDAAILTRLSNVTADEVLKYISEAYYENPLEIVMLPITTVEVYPPEPTEGNERLIELQFAYGLSNSVLTTYSGWLRSAVRDVAEAASGENDAEILLSLCTALSELAEYDAALGSLSEYSTQSTSATAYGALLGDSAIGEGYAMAYKALCDSLSLPCSVVLGTRDGLPYAWNIVSYSGSSYHIDPALCDVASMEEGFFKSDNEISERYDWDRSSYPICDGLLTYNDVVNTNVYEDAGVVDLLDNDEASEEYHNE